VKPVLKKFLKVQAHTLKPIVIIGQNGLSEAVINEINLALDHHELLKVRVNAADRDIRKEMIEQITSTLSADLVQAIGHIATIYRKRPKKT
jgi:RNA-binding protein